LLPTTKRQRLKLHKIPVMAYLEPEQVAALRALSLRTHVPQQVYLRQGLDLILKAKGANVSSFAAYQLPSV
jgi:hypothetical protein